MYKYPQPFSYWDLDNGVKKKSTLRVRALRGSCLVTLTLLTIPLTSKTISRRIVECDKFQERVIVCAMSCLPSFRSILFFSWHGSRSLLDDWLVELAFCGFAALLLCLLLWNEWSCWLPCTYIVFLVFRLVNAEQTALHSLSFTEAIP